jgi:hypothetical protein
LLLQELTGSAWSYMIFDGAERVESLWISMLYFDMFHMIAQLIFISLFTGIIMEIFTVVDEE